MLVFNAPSLPVRARRKRALTMFAAHPTLTLAFSWLRLAARPRRANTWRLKRLIVDHPGPSLPVHHPHAPSMVWARRGCVETSSRFQPWRCTARCPPCAPHGGDHDFVTSSPEHGSTPQTPPAAGANAVAPEQVGAPDRSASPGAAADIRTASKTCATPGAFPQPEAADTSANEQQTAEQAAMGPVVDEAPDHVGVVLWLLPPALVVAVATLGQFVTGGAAALAISALVAAAAAVLLRSGAAGPHLASRPAAGTVAVLIGLASLAVASTRTDLNLTKQEATTSAGANKPKDSETRTTSNRTRPATHVPVHMDGQRITQEFVDTHSMRAASLRAADLSGLDLSRADFEGADARGANFRRANLAQANAAGADLRGADLTRTCLDRTNLHGADLHGVTATGADTTDTAVDPGANRTAAAWPTEPQPTACAP